MTLGVYQVCNVSICFSKVCTVAQSVAYQIKHQEGNNSNTCADFIPVWGHWANFEKQNTTCVPLLSGSIREDSRTETLTATLNPCFVYPFSNTKQKILNLTCSSQHFLLPRFSYKLSTDTIHFSRRENSSSFLHCNWNLNTRFFCHDHKWLTRFCVFCECVKSSS